MQEAGGSQPLPEPDHPVDMLAQMYQHIVLGLEQTHLPCSGSDSELDHRSALRGLFIGGMTQQKQGQTPSFNMLRPARRAIVVLRR